MPDDPSSLLSPIRADIEETVYVYNLDGAGKNSYPVSAAMVRHARSLLAAVDAALKLADEWEATVATLDGGTARANALLDCTASFRAAITTALAGEEAGDGG